VILQQLCSLRTINNVLFVCLFVCYTACLLLLFILIYGIMCVIRIRIRVLVIVAEYNFIAYIFYEVTSSTGDVKWPLKSAGVVDSMLLILICRPMLQFHQPWNNSMHSSGSLNQNFSRYYGIICWDLLLPISGRFVHPSGLFFFYIVNIFFLFSLLLVIVLLENDMGYCYYFTCLSGISSHVGPAKPSLPAGRD